MAQTGQQIADSRTGQRMIFLQTAQDTQGRPLKIEAYNPGPRGPEPEHVHPEQESTAEVLAGTLHFRVRGELRIVHAGEKIVIPANTPHTFWNAGAEEARAVHEFRPALRTEEFFETLFQMEEDGTLGENGIPSLMLISVLLPLFGREIRPTSPPWPILRALCWVLAPVARVRGLHRLVPNQPVRLPGPGAP